MGNCEIQEAPGSLVVTWRRGCGIGDVFLLIWLIGWTCGLIAVSSSDWSASSLLALVPMGLAEVLVLGLYLQSVVGWDRLTFEPDKITFQRSAVVTFHKRTIATANVNSIGLRPPDPTAEPYRTARLIIAASGNREIHFGKGLGLEELRRLLLYLQQRLDEQQTVFASRINPNVSASINNAICEANDADKPESLPVRILGWLTVPFFILGGYVFVIGGVAGIATGHPLAILFGLLFTGIGLVLSVGLTWSTIRVFRDWLHQRKARTSPAPTNPQRVHPRQLTQIDHRLPLNHSRQENMETLSSKLQAANVRLAPPIALEEVRAFESNADIKLPQDYVTFITTIGNGGVGPYCRLMPLARWSWCHWIDDPQNNHSLTSPCIVTPDATALGENWLSEVGVPQWEERFDAGEWDPMFGTIAVAEIGCGLYYSLIINGPHTGRVFRYGDRVENPPKFVEQMTFAQWLEHEVDTMVEGETHEFLATKRNVRR
ncbi:MAG TPA: SMI1/KNR4 family protein [Phycisphaerae bacterium]|nr:SMI1/KNR4 family protein [Phycisphaerae bacterium]